MRLQDIPTPSGRLRAAMSTKRLSFRDLAFLTGLSAAYLCRVASGKRQPSKKAALAIAKAVGVSPALLWAER
jgi:transcriptional regulator with XRE-family HTH domain